MTWIGCIALMYRVHVKRKLLLLWNNSPFFGGDTLLNRHHKEINICFCILLQREVFSPHMYRDSIAAFPISLLLSKAVEMGRDGGDRVYYNVNGLAMAVVMTMTKVVSTMGHGT